MQHRNSDIDAIVQLSGGFGNQLFQYAFGMQLEAIHARRVAYDIEFYKRPNEIAHNRLHLIEYGFDVPTVPGLPSGISSARRFKWMPPAAQQALFGLTYVKCPATQFRPVCPTSGLTYYAGLWHSPKYFDVIGDEVRAKLRGRLLSLNGVTASTRQGTVGFHVRRGDYLTHKQSDNLDYQSYLSAALARLSRETGRSDWCISVYTDDPDWCAVNLSQPGIEINRGGGMLDDFLAFMQCEHKIISNSTFAWWAAFLGEAQNSLVLAPRRWHATATSEEAQVLRDAWIVVDA